tara:strand:- start:257 stop:466 length:210 start_codon:yes stop_codon:yes gene_type:complete
MSYERLIEEEELSLDDKIFMSAEKIKNMENLVIEMENLSSEQDKIDEVIANINLEKTTYDTLIEERDDG